MDDSGISRQVDGTLGVHEDAQSFLVVINEDAEDWLVRFEKAPDFEAQGWAEHMANTYNDRRPVGRTSRGGILVSAAAFQNRIADLDVGGRTPLASDLGGAPRSRERSAS